MEKVNMIKEIRGINTYKNVIDTQFNELIVQPESQDGTPFTVADFFTQYNTLFYDIPLTGINSHSQLIQRSTEYVGGQAIDEEKQALIEEINSLKQQIIDLSETYLNISQVTS
jgi:hypothetical protein